MVVSSKFNINSDQNDIRIQKVDNSIEFLMDLSNLIRSKKIELNGTYSDIFLKQVKIHIDQNKL